MQESQLKSLINGHIHHGIIAIDRAENITVCNKAAQMMLELRHPVVGRPAISLKLELADNLSREHGSNSHNLLELITSGHNEFYKMCRCDDKTYIVNQVPIYDGNRINGSVTIFQDITELEDLTKELESFKTLSRDLEDFIENTYDGIIITDGDGTVVKINNSLLRVTNLIAEQFLGVKIDSLYINGQFMNEPIAKIARIKKQVTTGLTRITTGKRVMVTSRPIINNEGKVVRVVSNVKDMTDIIGLLQQPTQFYYPNELHASETNLSLRDELYANGMITCNRDLLKTMELTRRIAGKDVTVLLQGESGVGKEIFATLIHNWSQRKGPLIKVNCGAIPATLLESELFGYSSGAFTGASKGGKPGLLELANNGTLFLDEIEDLPFDLQGKFLRVLQEQEFVRLGGTKTIKVNIRLVAACNRDLLQMVRENLFRLDLYYRLNVIPIFISPLRDRKEDIPLLVEFFLGKFNKKYGTCIAMTPGLIDRLQDYQWPGNIRELMNILERLIITCESDIINQDMFDAAINGKFSVNNVNEHDSTGTEPDEMGIPYLKDALEQTERALLTKALNKYKKSRKVGQVLGISHTAVLKKMKKYQISC